MDESLGIEGGASLEPPSMVDSGHTLSVVVNFNTRRVVGFGSDNKEWHSLTVLRRQDD